MKYQETQFKHKSSMRILINRIKVNMFIINLPNQVTNSKFYSKHNQSKQSINDY